MAVFAYASWKARPFLRILPPFAAGLAAQSYFPLPPGLLFSITIILLLLYGFFQRQPVRIRFRFSFLQGIVLNLLLLAAGMMGYCLRGNTRNQLQHLSRGATLLLTLEEDLSVSGKYGKAVAAITATDAGKKEWKRESKKLQLYFGTGNDSLMLKKGARLITRKLPEPIRQNNNPGEFDYARYARIRGIIGRLWLSAGDFKTAPSGDGPGPADWPQMARQKLLQILRRFVPGRREQGLAEALLTGYRKNLDADLMQSYSQSGVVHLVAISGLHVGLVYGMLLFLFRPVSKGPRLRMLAVFLPLAGTWFFAFLSGASASVLRASLMFTGMALAPMLGRQTSSFNGLAASAFLLLVINPLWLWDAGFQLSYAAVTGILVFARPLTGLLQSAHTVLFRIWQLCSVTLAAQAFSFPIVLYHFHQFPNYFLIANLAALPLASLILSGEIALCVLSPLTSVAILLGKALSLLIGLLNHITETTSAWPGSISENIFISVPETLLLLSLVAALAGIWPGRNRLALPIGLFLFTCLCAERAVTGYEKAHRRRLIVYRVSRRAAADLQRGRKAWRLFPASSKSEAEQYLDKAGGPRAAMGIYRVSDPPMNHDWLATAGYCIWRVGRRAAPWSPPPGTRQLIVLVSAAASDGWIRFLPPGIATTVVICSDVSKPLTLKWKAECRQLSTPCHAVVDKGAFVVSLP